MKLAVGAMVDEAGAVAAGAVVVGAVCWAMAADASRDAAATVKNLMLFISSSDPLVWGQMSWRRENIVLEKPSSIFCGVDAENIAISVWKRYFSLCPRSTVQTWIAR
jgi:hypothetical protein